MKILTYKLDCLISNEKIQKELIGEIILAKHKDKITLEDIFEAFKKADFTESILDIQLNDICILQDGTFVSCNENSVMILGT